MLKRLWGRLEKRWVATESGGDETGGSRDETGNKTEAMAGDERDGGNRWGNVYGRRSVYNRRPPSLFGEHCEILRWRTLRKTLKRWWGRLEKRRVVTVRRGRDRRSRGRDRRQDGGDGWWRTRRRRPYSRPPWWTALAAGPQPDHLQNSEVVPSRTSRQSTDIPGCNGGSISADWDIAFIRPTPAHRTGITNQDWSAQVLVFSAQSVELHPTSNTNDDIPNSFQNSTEDISVRRRVHH